MDMMTSPSGGNPPAQCAPAVRKRPGAERHHLAAARRRAASEVRIGWATHISI